LQVPGAKVKWIKVKWDPSDKAHFFFAFSI